MNYTVRKAYKEDLKIIKEYKKHSIFDYANNLSIDEIERINNYIDDNLNLDEYKVIFMNDKIIGAYSVTKGNLLEEIYIEEEYRNKGIGSNIIKNLIDEHKTLSLWVYKNNKAFELYKSLGFKVDKITENRYFMVYKGL